jgi:hypothetical protein
MLDAVESSANELSTLQVRQRTIAVCPRPMSDVKIMRLQHIHPHSEDVTAHLVSRQLSRSSS